MAPLRREAASDPDPVRIVGVEFRDAESAGYRGQGHPMGVVRWGLLALSVYYWCLLIEDLAPNWRLDIMTKLIDLLRYLNEGIGRALMALTLHHSKLCEENRTI